MNVTGFHDAELQSVHVSRDGASLQFALSAGTVGTLLLKGVRAFRIRDMVLQNVVYRALGAKELTEEQTLSWVTWATGTSQGPSWLTDEKARKWVDEIRSGVLQILVLEPSVGAELCAIYKEVTSSAPEIQEGEVS
jgi:hypothetical protein